MVGPDCFKWLAAFPDILQGIVGGMKEEGRGRLCDESTVVEFETSYTKVCCQPKVRFTI